MKNLKLYEGFVSYPNKNEIEALCKKYGIIWNHKINDDGSVDVYGDVILTFQENTLKIKNYKIPIKFGSIYGGFHFCESGLTSLDNSPNYVMETFSIYGNRLKTLIGCPDVVDRIYCDGNDLRDVYGFPSKCSPDWFGIRNNPICEILDLAPNRKVVKFIRLLNEYSVIRNMDTVILDRLKVALEYVGVKSIDSTDIDNISYIDFQYYKII